MTDYRGHAIKRRKKSRAWLIFIAVAIAVAIPILPLRFLGIPGPDFWPDVQQVVESGRTWFNSVTSRSEGVIEANSLPPGSTKAPTAKVEQVEQVKVYEAAAQQLQKEIERSPMDPALQNRLGLVYLSLGDSQSALTHFEKAVSLSRLGISRLKERIVSLKAGGKTREASVALLDASKLQIELSAAHSNLARIYEKLGNHQQVVAELDMINRDGNFFEETGTTTIATGPVIKPEVAQALARAESLVQARQWPQAAAEYRRLLGMDPNIAIAHHRLGVILAMSHDTAMAIDELEIAAKLLPNSSTVQNDLGLTYQMMGMTQPALAAFEKAIALDEKNVDAAVNLSDSYSSVGRLDEAARVLVSALKYNSNSAKAHNNLGTILSLQGHFGPAQYEFGKAISLSPNMASAHYGMGIALMQTKSYLPAARSFKQALALNPSMVDAQNKIEEAYRRAGMASGSVQAMN